jgi:hypothetical protein
MGQQRGQTASVRGWPVVHKICCESFKVGFGWWLEHIFLETATQVLQGSLFWTDASVCGGTGNNERSTVTVYQSNPEKLEKEKVK